MVKGSRILGGWLLVGGVAFGLGTAGGATPEPPPPTAAATAPPAHGDEGIACAHCHADVHQGTVGAACQTCHTAESWAPSTFTVARHAETRFPLTGDHATASCALCHPNAKLVGQPTECAGCHLDRHRGTLGAACTECHSTEAFAPVPGFDHAGRTGFALTGPHGEGVACADCHQGARGRSLLVAAEPGCGTCHAPSHGDFGACEVCHGPERATFAGASFDHRTTSFPLERRHSALPCDACHAAGSTARAMPDDCQACHPDPHAGQLSMVCADCHRPDRWRLVRFDHDATTVPLRGSHFLAPCASCHTNQRWLGLPTDCFGCHSGEAARGLTAAPGVAAHASGIGECGDCHDSWKW